MFLISKSMYEAVYEQDRILIIRPREIKNYIGNFYYFRLGHAAEVRDGGSTFAHKKNKEEISFPPNDLVKIWSLEEFTLSNRVLGLFGNKSELVLKGLQLVHSPSVDPGFKGYLEMCIKNNTSQKITLPVGKNIGKILFFDISDSHIETQEFLKTKKKELEGRANPKHLYLYEDVE